MVRAVRSRLELDGGDLTIGEAASAIGVHKNALRRWPADTLPYHLVGTRRDRRYQSADVADYLEGRSAGTPHDTGIASRARLQQVRETQEIQRTMALAARQAEAAGADELARRLRHVRSIVNDRLRISD
jgi:DNA-binding transcriptional MerR regulator